jgi:C-terminal processing protease CtpA/Prc
MKQWETDGSLNTQPSARIKRAAILVDVMTASAAESLVQYVKKYSNRAKVYGLGNTYGCEMTGNCRTEPLPNSRFGVFYATSIDSEFFEKDFSSEGLGIPPDVIIPLPFPRKLTDNIDDWVLWVAKDLKKK